MSEDFRPEISNAMTAVDKIQQAGEKDSSWPTVAMIGCYPPPYGGISVHLERLIAYLERQGVNCVLYNVISDAEKPPRVLSRKRFRAFWIIWFCLFHRCPIVHMQLPNWSLRLVFGICAALRRGKYVQSIQGRSISISMEHPSRIRRALTRWILHKMDFVIASNPDIYSECIDRVGLDPGKLADIPAFIPPQRDNIVDPPAPIKAYIDRHDPVLSAVGWIGKVLHGADEYGVDMLIELVERLHHDFPRLGLLFSVNGGDEGKIRQTVKDCGDCLGDAMLLVTEDLPDISSIIKQSDLFLRPTNTDGDSVSVREALYFGTPVVASDAVPRAEPVVIFRTRDMDDFESAVRQSLEDLGSLRDRTRASGQSDNAEKILEVYRTLLKDK